MPPSSNLSFAQVIDALRQKHGWQLADQIGQGGFAQVYKELIDGMPRAVKIPFAPLALSEEHKQRELQGLEVARRMAGHPRVVGLIHYELLAGYLVTVWEWADGGSLGQLLQQYQDAGQPGIPVDKLVRYMLEAAEGIDALNGQGVYHRDIKPENLLLFHGHVKVGDLGLAKIVGASTASHTGVGTLGYLPPEAYETHRLVPTVDVYSLVATYVRLRSGRLPFGTSATEILDRQRRGEPVVEGLWEPERPLVRRALAADPEQRYSRGAVAWVKELYRSLRERPASPEVPQRTSTEQGQNGAIVGATAGAIVGAIAGASLGAILGAVVGETLGAIVCAILVAPGGAIVGAIQGAKATSDKK